MSICRRLHLEARDPGRNCFRHWQLDAQLDLFGRYLVQITYGRIGGQGRTITRSFTDAREASRYIRNAIARRRSSPRRIGIPYRVLIDESWPAAERATG
ncbi:WGR domain-containing protein [Acidocella sp.]|uniref:WGR domain-containing protein n=1 Tax=Acidocella sp. TaxID=50710 RepID=UPI003D0220D8